MASSCISRIALQAAHVCRRVRLPLSHRLSGTPEGLKQRFLSLETPQDVADLLEVGLDRLHYHIYVVPRKSRYTMFEIPKKRGGTRTISAPATALKIIQQKVNEVLLHVYSGKPSVHSFVPSRSILTNARVHTGRKNVLNVDLKDFYPSINFGRVRGMFMGPPYKLNSTVATVLAQICCFNNQLPQGAPSSPIVSNMICAKMDSQLQSLARQNRCHYTRYADDITFSTNLRDFPPNLATISDLGQAETGVELKRVIAENGFEVNTSKVRLLHRNRRQEVTGLVVNEFPNIRRKLVRQIRAMLHAWEKFGLEAAEEEFLSHYDRKHRSPQKDPPSFKRVVKGKIDFLGMVRGKDDAIYLALRRWLGALDPSIVTDSHPVAPEGGHTHTSAQVWTEGKSDYNHLRAALAWLDEPNEYAGLSVRFADHQDDMGDQELLRMCKTMARIFQPNPVIFIFDRDNPRIVDQVSSESEGYKEWGNNVFSFTIPVPEHRRDNPNISIEFYYKDEEIKRCDARGRRLFISNEFDSKSGRNSEMGLNCTQLNKVRGSNPSIIDCDVYDGQNENVALPKADFSEYVLNRTENFDNFDFSEFRRIFDHIALIVGLQK